MPFAFMERWRGETAVVTEADGVIGAEICKALVKEGLIVIGCGDNLPPIEKLARVLEVDEDVQKVQGKLVPVRCNVKEENEIIAMFENIKNDYEVISICINSAGVTECPSMFNGEVEDWLEMLQEDVLPTCICTREAMKVVENSGVIIQMGCISGHKAEDTPESDTDVDIYINGTRAMVIALDKGMRQVIDSNQADVRSWATNSDEEETEEESDTEADSSDKQEEAVDESAPEADPSDNGQETGEKSAPEADPSDNGQENEEKLAPEADPSDKETVEKSAPEANPSDNREETVEKSAPEADPPDNREETVEKSAPEADPSDNRQQTEEKSAPKEDPSDKETEEKLAPKEDPSDKETAEKSAPEADPSGKQKTAEKSAPEAGPSDNPEETAEKSAPEAGTSDTREKTVEKSAPKAGPSGKQDETEDESAPEADTSGEGSTEGSHDLSGECHRYTPEDIARDIIQALNIPNDISSDEIAIRNMAYRV